MCSGTAIPNTLPASTGGGIPNPPNSAQTQCITNAVSGRSADITEVCDIQRLSSEVRIAKSHAVKLGVSSWHQNRVSFLCKNDTSVSISTTLFSVIIALQCVRWHPCSISYYSTTFLVSCDNDPSQCSLVMDNLLCRSTMFVTIETVMTSCRWFMRAAAITVSGLVSLNLQRGHLILDVHQHNCIHMYVI